MTGYKELAARAEKYLDLGMRMGQMSDSASNIYRIAADLLICAKSQQARIEALEAERPQFTGVARHKLDMLLADGWEISGYAISKNGEHGLVTTGSLVGWWSVAVANAEAIEAERDEARRHVEGKEMAAKAYYENYRDEEARANAAEARCKRLEEALRIAEAVLRHADPFSTTDGGHIPDTTPRMAAEAARLALQENTNGG